MLTGEPAASTRFADGSGGSWDCTVWYLAQLFTVDTVPTLSAALLISSVAAAWVKPTTFGTGPADTVRSTGELTGSTVLPGEFCPMTVSAAAAFGTRVTWPTLRPLALTALVAAD